jgi:hypothetical protein
VNPPPKEAGDFSAKLNPETRLVSKLKKTAKIAGNIFYL